MVESQRSGQQRWTPASAGFHHHVEDGDELSRTSHESDLRRFPSSERTLILRIRERPPRLRCLPVDSPNYHFAAWLSEGGGVGG